MTSPTKRRQPYCGRQLAETQKGHSPDSAAEGFLGYMKTESVYPEHWEECACDEVLVLIDDYIHWYNHARIKRSFGWMRPVECRQRTKEGLRDCLQENVRSTFFHAECGGEFDDPGIGEPLGVFGVERPLSCKGNSCGNAVVESTNRPLEKGLDHRTRYTSVDRLRAELNDCVYWFNNQRLHSMLG